MSNKDYRIVSSETTHIGRFDIVYDTIEHNGKESPYSYVKMKRGVGVIGMVNNSIILLKQYRYIWNETFWEIPAGMVDDGEEPIDAARREMEEETGYHIEKIKFLGICYPSIGSTTEIQYLYYAECADKGKQRLDAIEDIDVQLVSVEEFERMIKEGKFMHGMGLAAWSYLKGEK